MKKHFLIIYNLNYSCDECDQSFRQKQLLKRHKNLYHNPEYIPPQPKEKTHECPHCCKAFRHKGNLMRHLVIHDPDAYKDSLGNYIMIETLCKFTNLMISSVVRANENHQLIDDEEEESEEDDDPDMILPTEDESLDQQTLQFTLDPQTQQMLQGGEQVVVFEVVQMNNNESGNEDQQNAYAELANFETPKKGAMVTKKALAKAMATTNGGPGLGKNIRSIPFIRQLISSLFHPQKTTL